MSKKTGGQYRKAVYFDLGTNELKKAYPGNNYRNAYSDIKKFMVRHGFKHRQYSGYDSVEPMSNTKVTLILKELSEEFPWLKKCVKQIDTTDIGDTYDMLNIVLNSQSKAKSKAPVKAKVSQNKGFDVAEKRPSLLADIENAKSTVNEYNQAHLPKNKKKDKDQSL